MAFLFNESKYNALTLAAKEAIWMQYRLIKLGILQCND